MIRLEYIYNIVCGSRNMTPISTDECKFLYYIEMDDAKKLVIFIGLKYHSLLDKVYYDHHATSTQILYRIISIYDNTDTYISTIITDFICNYWIPPNTIRNISFCKYITLNNQYNAAIININDVKYLRKNIVYEDQYGLYILYYGTKLYLESFYVVVRSCGSIELAPLQQFSNTSLIGIMLYNYDELYEVPPKYNSDSVSKLISQSPTTLKKLIKNFNRVI